jgi:hypothetical protein
LGAVAQICWLGHPAQASAFPASSDCVPGQSTQHQTMFRNTNTLEPSLGKATQQSKQLHGALKLRIYISDETRKIPPLLVRKRRSNSRKTWLQKAGPKRKQGKRKNEPTGGHGGNDSLRSFASSGTSRLPPPFSICLSPSPAVPERTGEVA